MTTKIGFLSDRMLRYGTFVSETDLSSKYGIEFSRSNQSIEDDNIAEFSIIDQDSNVALNANGLIVRCFKTGPLIDKHDNYRSSIQDHDFSLGVARFSVKDYEETNDYKSKDEYWAQREYEPISDETNELSYHVCHSDGTTMMMAYVVAGSTDNIAKIYVKIRNETNRSWGSAILVDEVYRKFSTTVTTFETITPRVAFVTIPNLGTLLFYFGLNDDARSNTGEITRQEQLVYASITKDNGQTWYRYTSFIIDPYYGNLVNVGDEHSSDYLPLAHYKTAQIKAIYHNNKIVLGLLMKNSIGEITKTQIIGTGTAGLDTFEDTLYVANENNNIKPYTVVAKKGVSDVCWDDGNGGFIVNPFYTGDIDTVNSYINYETKEIKIIESGSGVWGASDDCDIEYELDGLHFERFLNIVYSKDLGKSWSVVQNEFFSKTYEGPFLSQNVKLGDDSGFGQYKFALPGNFGLGVDPESDKIILVCRSSGLYKISSPLVIHELKNISNLYFFYNVDDDLFHWESNRVEGSAYDLIDGFSVNNIEQHYQSGYTQGTSTITVVGEGNWYAENGFLQQTGYVKPFSAWSESATITIKGGAELLYKDYVDPTLNRTIGVHVDLKTKSTGNFGLLFCHSSSGGYAVAINTYNNIAKLGLYVWDSGSSDYINVSATSDVQIDYPKDSWGSIDVLFKEDDQINVYFNNVLVISGNDNTFREGTIGLFCLAQDETEFDNLALNTSINSLVIVGGTEYYNNYFNLGTNIDLTIDQFNQAWICADVQCINLGSTIFDNYGISFQRLRLEKDIERVEGKFLAKDKYVVKFYDQTNPYYQENIGGYFSLLSYGLMAASHASIDTSPNERPLLESFIWHKGDPVFMVRRGSTVSPQKYVIQRPDYSNKSIYTNFGCTWNPLGSQVNPDECGWTVSGTYSNINGYILTMNENSYAQQYYNQTTGIFNTDSLESSPLRYFDYIKRGLIADCITRANSANGNGVGKVIMEVSIPNIADSGGTDKEVRVRIIMNDESSSGAKDGSITVSYWNGSSWTSLGSTSPNLDTKIWFEIMLNIIPVDLSSHATNPEVSVYYRIIDSEPSNWKTIIEGDTNTVPQTILSGIVSYVYFGCKDSDSSNCKQDYKFMGYSDTCFIKHTDNPIRGESISSGERVYAPKNIVYTVSGGLAIEEDEWEVTDLSYRRNGKENLLDRKSAYWISNDDSEDKSIVIDAGHIMEYNCIALIGCNTRYIQFEANDTDSWSSPALSIQLDLVQEANIDIEKFTGKNNIIKTFISQNDYPKDSLIDKLFVTDVLTHGTFRITHNAGRFINYISELPSPPTIPVGTWKMNLISTKIAMRFTTRRKNRYFRITCKKASQSYPTPDGFFKIGKLSIGIFNQLEWNPEYNEETIFNTHVKISKSIGGSIRTKRLGPVTKEKTLTFKAINARKGEFKDQLINLIHNSNKTVSLIYIPDIEENTYSNYGHYSFNIMNVLVPNKTKVPLKWGTLSDIQLKLTETD